MGYNIELAESVYQSKLLVCRAVVEHVVNFSNFLVIWDKVALDESDIVHRLTQNT